MLNNKNEKSFINKKKKFRLFNNIAGLSFSTSLFFCILFIVSSLLGGLFNEYYGENKTININVLYIVTYIFILLSFVTLIIGIIFVTICQKEYRRRINYFNDQEKKTFLSYYLFFQGISFGLIMIGLFIIILGIDIKNAKGIILAIIGLILSGIGIGLIIYIGVKRMMYSEKSKLVGDIINQNGLLSKQKLGEKLFLISILIIYIVFLFLFLTNQTAVNKNIALILSIIILTYLEFSVIRCLNKNKKNRSK